MIIQIHEYNILFAAIIKLGASPKVNLEFNPFSSWPHPGMQCRTLFLTCSLPRDLPTTHWAGARGTQVMARHLLQRPRRPGAVGLLWQPEKWLH